ncbi:DUF3467 domain-containing protein [Candidatus Woesearchaeota archaeon]|nr:DUF3467 domain-containing protein [Candidatus Woesearchaeota archaeon]
MAEQQQQEIRVDVENGNEFLADEVSISHSPIRFVVDFKSVTPRIDLSNHPPRMVVKHNIVLLDPSFAKELFNVLKDNLSKYEAKFGEIKKPEALKKHEAEMGKTSGAKTAKQDYFG